MDYENILVEYPAEGVGLVRLNRPRAFNSLTGPLMDELMGALEGMDADDAIGCMIITGNEKAFAAGADISEMAGATPVEMINMAFIARWERLRGMRKPVIAAVSGYALGGGCELALACDFRIAADHAKFGMRQIMMGIMSAWGGGQRLARLVGRSDALYLMLTADTFDAAEAYRIGFVNRVVTSADLHPTARLLAEKIADKPAMSVKFIKRSVNNGLQMPLQAAIAYEAEMMALLWGTDDHHEAEAAFVEKRKPVFNKKKD